MEHEFDLGSGNTRRMSCSIGFAMYPFVPSAPDLLSWEQVLHMADAGCMRRRDRVETGTLESVQHRKQIHRRS